MKKSKKAVAIIAVLMLTGLLVKCADLSSINIPLCNKAPKIDGILNDGCWEAASKIKDFYIYARGPVGSVTNDTELFITRDNAWLYIGAICKNPDMQHLNLAGKKYDEPTIYKDDAIEVFLGRSDQNEKGRLFRYIVNFANVHAEMLVTETGEMKRYWNIPWITATKAGDKGWTAEIAIPLFPINSTPPKKVRINFCRNRILVSKDHMGAKLSEKKVISFWSWPLRDLRPDQYIANCGTLLGLDNLKAPKIFLPQAMELKFKHFKIDKGVIGTWELMLENFTDVPGRVMFTVKNGIGDKCYQKDVEIGGLKTKTITFSLPIDATKSGNALLCLKDAASGKQIQVIPMGKKGRIFTDIYADHNYYTSEKQVKVRCLISLNQIEKCVFKLEDNAGRSIYQNQARKKMEFSFPCGKLKIGPNKVKAVLQHSSGKVLASQVLLLLKLAPNPGKEIKIDRFRRIVLKNGKAFFPFGIYENLEMKGLYPDFKKACDEHFSMLKATGFNTVIRAYRRLGVVRKDPFKANEYMEMLKKYDLMFIDFYGDLLCARSKDHDYYEKKVLAGFMNDYNVISKSPNLLGYYNLDEPNLGAWTKNLEICDWFYKDMKKLDPYRISFLLYACSIPRTENALTSGDVFAYDAYYYPGWKKSPRGNMNYSANMTAELNERVKPFHKTIMMVLQPISIGVNRSPISISYQEQINQAYAALIYGSKGIIYYHSYITWGEHTWRAFKKLAADIKIFEPALMSEAPDYRISYKKSKVDITKGILPQVHVGLFRYPDGRYLLLMANGNWYPMNIELNIPGLLKASGICGDGQKYSVAKGTFNARFEKYGVRAIELKVENVDGPLEIMAKESGKVPHDSRVYVEDMLRIVKKRKNKAFNPSFELCSAVEGVIPDYYSPGFAMPGAEKIGLKDNKTWGLDTNNPFFGKYCMRTAHVVNSMMYMPKGDAYPQKYMFSAYMKGDKNGDEIVVGIASVVSQKFKLTTEWKRYSMAFTVEKPGNKSLLRSAFYPQRGATVWIDGIQVEKGEKMTPFSEK